MALEGLDPAALWKKWPLFSIENLSAKLVLSFGVEGSVLYLDLQWVAGANLYDGTDYLAVLC